MSNLVSSSKRNRSGFAWHRLIGIALIGAALASALYWRGHTAPRLRRVHELAGVVFSTLYDVKVIVGYIGEEERTQLRTVVEQALELVDERMSCHKPDSEITKLSHAPAGQWMPISQETAQVLALARRTSEWSHGAFDVTVGPLVRLWGFHDKKTLSVEPPAQQVEELRLAMGYAKLELDPSGKAARRLGSAIEVDLSAIAKGYGVDLVSRRLTEAGYPEHLVEVGGEIQARGKNARGEPWRIAVQNPTENGKIEKDLILSLEDVAVATSGDYQNYYEIDGKRLSHTIDPRTGRPIAHKLASITVVHKNCADADALATALNVLGPQEGYALALESELPALFLTRNDTGGFSARTTPALERYKAPATTEKKP